MRRYLLILFLVVGLLFSGCSSTNFFGGNSNKAPQEDVTGSGLDVKLDIDDDWIGEAKVDYFLTIGNTGADEIKLTADNFKLYTLQVHSSGVGGVFTDVSIQNFYSNIFQAGDLILPQNAELTGISGQLNVADWFFSDPNIEKFDYVLEVIYDYRTHFTNNLEITKGEKNVLKVLDKISQAAPVQIQSIELDHFDGDEFYLSYEISNAGGADLEDSLIKLKNFDFNFRGNPLHDCIGYYLNDEDVRVRLELNEIILNKDRSEVFYACKVSLSDYDKFVPTTTSTSGEFEYTYTIFETGSVNLPDTRENKDFWG